MRTVCPLSRLPVIPLKIRNYILCILCAILLILSFPKFNLWILGWFGFVPLFFALQDKSKIRAFLLSYLTGVIFWLGTIYWLIHVTFVGLVLLVLYLALYFGIFGLIISLTHLHTYTLIQLFLIPSVWVILEYLRSYLFTGFPWALLGYSQYLNLPVIQIADVTGVWGVSFLVVMVNVFIYKVIGYRLKVKGKDYLLPILFFLVSLFYGYYRLYLSPFTFHLSPIRISVIQPNIPQSIKWQEYAKEEIFEQYLQLSSKALLDNSDLIIWPEAALPCVLEEEPLFFERLKDFVKEIDTPLLLGAVTSRDNLYYNSALFISKDARRLRRYDKLHLVPFGEYIPLKRIFGFLNTVVPIGDFTAGKEYTVFSYDARHITHDTIGFSVLICFEDIFPELSREFVRRGAHFLVNITNDAWFSDTSAPYQHLQASVFRAVENRVYLVRAANTGISGFITPAGKIYPLQESGSAKQTFISEGKTKDIIIPKSSKSFYCCWADAFIFLCLFITSGGIILRWSRRGDAKE